MIRYLAFCVCVAVAFGARERRQVACVEPMVKNVCQQGLNGPLHFPHPTDNNRFLQCAPGGRMFIIKCPDNEVYHPESTSCGLAQPIVTAKPQPPVVQPVSNPCTAQNIASGNIFFPDLSDNKKFIECTSQGQPLTLTCPTQLVYDAAKQGCILPTGSTQTGTGTGGSQTVTVTMSPQTGGVTPPATGSVSGNPCAGAMTAGQELYFPFPLNQSKYFQCDLAGNAFIRRCPANLVWNQSTSRCDTSYNLAAQTQSVG